MIDFEFRPFYFLCSFRFAPFTKKTKFSKILDKWRSELSNFVWRKLQIYNFNEIVFKEVAKVIWLSKIKLDNNSVQIFVSDGFFERLSLIGPIHKENTNY